MPDTNAQNTKGQAFRAKAAIHRAMALFTDHWGVLHRLLGQETCEQNDRGNTWRDCYDNLDGMGHESIDSRGEFADEGVQARLDEVEGVKQTLDAYREAWKGFTASEEQAAAFGEAMLLLNEVTAALDQADEFIRACLPSAEPEVAQEPGDTGGGADAGGEAADRGEGEPGATGDDTDRTVPDPEPDPRP